MTRGKIGKYVLHLAQMSEDLSQYEPQNAPISLPYMPYVLRHIVELFWRVVRCNGSVYNKIIGKNTLLRVGKAR